jgi:hypothetical protein
MAARKIRKSQFLKGIVTFVEMRFAPMKRNFYAPADGEESGLRTQHFPPAV